MKKVIIPLIIVLLAAIITCSKHDDVDELGILQVKPEVAKEYLNGMQDQVKDDDAEAEDLIFVEYRNTRLGVAIEAYYELFKNLNHTNGYVIIHRVLYKDKMGDYDIVIQSRNDPGLYISTIHNHSEFLMDTPEGVRGLDDIWLNGVFRTAEAMIICDRESGGDIKEEDMVEVRNRMEGRTTGVPITE